MISDSKCMTQSVQSTGDFFLVTNKIKDTIFPPGTAGFMSFVAGAGNKNPNVAYHKIITVRRGKKGKERLNINTIKTLIFNLPEISLSEEELKNQEYKNIIDIDLTTNNINKEITTLSEYKNNLQFLGWLLSRSLLVKELNSVVYDGNNKIIQHTEASHKYMNNKINILNNHKKSRLTEFISNIVECFNNGDLDYINDRFTNKATKFMLINELRTAETQLIIPRLEYQNRVCSVLLNALKSIETKVNEDNLKLIKNTIKSITNKQKFIDKTILLRLEKIVSLRQLTY